MAASPPQWLELQLDASLDQDRDLHVRSPENLGLKRLGRDGFVLLKTLALDLFAYTLMKNIHIQPRGLSPSRQAYRSLSNGRSSQAFAIAAAVSSLAAYSEMPDRLRRSVVASAHALAATTAMIRVAGGQENLRDALLGAAIGSAIGFVIPHLHRSRGEDRQVLASMRVRPAVFDGGVGINTSLRF